MKVIFISKTAIIYTNYLQKYVKGSTLHIPINYFLMIDKFVPFINNNILRIEKCQRRKKANLRVKTSRPGRQ